MLAQATFHPAIASGAINGLASADIGEATQLLPIVGVRLTYRRGEEVFGEGEPAEFVYSVISGAVRTYRVLSDGRRQISDFHLEGDTFGLEAGAEHRIGCEAMTDTVLQLVRRKVLAKRAAEDCDFAGRLWEMTARSLQCTREHMMLLGRQGACERVCTFLLDLSARVGAAHSMVLPMSRQDMADYLGLTIETVSRTFTQLQAWDWIALPSTRRLVFKDRAAMTQLCS